MIRFLSIRSAVAIEERSIYGIGGRLGASIIDFETKKLYDGTLEKCGWLRKLVCKTHN